MGNEFSRQQCHALMDTDGVLKGGTILYTDGRWHVVEMNEPRTNYIDNYLVPTLPVEIHFHGINRFDFSTMSLSDLTQINKLLIKRHTIGVPTMFLPYQNFEIFLQTMDAFDEAKRAGQYSHIAGISLEGPMLSSIGGTPETGNWLPNESEWQQIAKCGPKGLVYVVLSPDFMLEGSTLRQSIPKNYPSIDWIIDLLLQNRVRPSLGHFQKTSIGESTQIIYRLTEIAEKYRRKGFSTPILTDHIFNDMPHNFKHAWRTQSEKRQRDTEIQYSPIHQLSWENLELTLGEVPASLLYGARSGSIGISMNFDGEHVDLEICRRLVELLDGQHLLAMTDSTETPHLGEQELHREAENSLWYQANQVVAAGSHNIYAQIQNMIALKLQPHHIWQLCSYSALRFLNPGLAPINVGDILKQGVLVTEAGNLEPFDTVADE